MKLTEEWKSIEGFEGIYEISNQGRLKSFKKNKDGLVLQNTNPKGGYFSVVIIYKEKTLYTRVHRLVALHFIENNCIDKKHVNHIDGNKQNNVVSNLEWVTPRENLMHSIGINPNQLKGMIYKNQFEKPKKLVQLNLKGEFIAEFDNSKIANDNTGICARNILQVASKDVYKINNEGKCLTRKQAGGFIWKYKQDYEITLS